MGGDGFGDLSLEVFRQLTGQLGQLERVPLAEAVPHFLAGQQQRTDEQLLAVEVGVAVLHDEEHLFDHLRRDPDELGELLHLGSLCHHGEGG